MRARIVAWGGLGLAIVFMAAYLVLLARDPIPIRRFDLVWIILQSAIALTYSATGALIVARRPENPVGWIFFGAGVLTASVVFASEYSIRAFVIAPGSLPLAMPVTLFASAIASVVWPTDIVLLLLLFPDGRLPSRRWWPVLFIALAIPITSLFYLVDPRLFATGGLRSIPLNVRNPIGLPVPDSVFSAIHNDVIGFEFVVALIGAVAAPIARWRRSTGIERQQLKWLAYATALIVLFIFVLAAPYQLGVSTNSILGAISFIAFLVAITIGIPGATAIAILRYRLYDIDIVIKRSLVFGALAVFISGVYVGIVAGVGALIGTQGRPSLGLSILATAIVAVAFQPVRERVERFANRLVYGKRATPYEVLSQFTERAGATYASEEILPRMAQVLAEGTGAARAAVWLRLGDSIAPAASWPSSDGLSRAGIALSGQLLPSIPGVSRVVPVRHQGELLGALSINKRPGEALTPIEDELLKNLGAQAGLVLRNVRLTAELRGRLDEISKQAAELRASRQRIAAAQDAERRRLERNIHDGAQQNLVALTVKLRLATNQAKSNPARAAQSVEALQAETNDALQTLRDLARGIYPPLLREQGVEAALRAQADKMLGRIEVSTHGIGRLDPEVEAAVYFCCLEALQNATKHARASTVRLNLEQENGELRFSVSDDGVGFDQKAASLGLGLQNMKDRVEALGGRLDVDSAPQSGTRVIGRIPALQAMVSA